MVLGKRILKMKTKFLSVIIVIIFNSCRHEPPVLSPAANVHNTGTANNNGSGGNNNGGTVNTCDTNVIYFNQEILPIFITNCTNNNSAYAGGCHDVTFHQDGVILTSYENVMNTADVEPFNLSAGDLFEVITTNDPDKRMPPPPAAALSSDQIDKIEKWIMQGTQNLSCTNSGCDSANVSFINKVWPIINNKCKGCHSGSAPGGNIFLIDYNAVSASAASGKLMGAITYKATYQPMPKNSSKLSSCEIGVISNWIAEGRSNN